MKIDLKELQKDVNETPHLKDLIGGKNSEQFSKFFTHLLARGKSLELGKLSYSFNSAQACAKMIYKEITEARKAAVLRRIAQAQRDDSDEESEESDSDESSEDKGEGKGMEDSEDSDEESDEESDSREEKVVKVKVEPNSEFFSSSDSSGKESVSSEEESV
ncbi:hypothetical protein TrRE_jg129, partial [Triparma retinervis]